MISRKERLNSPKISLDKLVFGRTVSSLLQLFDDLVPSLLIATDDEN